MICMPLSRRRQSMLQDSKRGLFDCVLTHKYDRVARNMSEHTRLEDYLEAQSVTLIAVTQDFGLGPEGKVVRRVMQALSEFYSENLSGEVKKGHNENALKGLHNGGYPPFGYDVVDKRYVINEVEATYVRKMFQCALDGVGYSALIQEMEGIGLRGKRGAVIRTPQITEILKNEKYTGVYLYSSDMETTRSKRREKPNAHRIENAHPAIISPSIFEQVRKIMESRKHTGKRAGYLCSGLVYCRCGAKMHTMIIHSLLRFFASPRNRLIFVYAYN